MSGLPYILGSGLRGPMVYRRSAIGPLNPNRHSCSVDVNRKIPKRQDFSLSPQSPRFIGTTPLVRALAGYHGVTRYRPVEKTCAPNTLASRPRDLKDQLFSLEHLVVRAVRAVRVARGVQPPGPDLQPVFARREVVVQEQGD